MVRDRAHYQAGPAGGRKRLGARPAVLLKGDARPWLLDPENPSIRYWTLVDILDRPASDPAVQEARAAIAHQPLVRELFALQHPEGYWGDDETKPYTAQGAVTALALLHMLGVTPD